MKNIHILKSDQPSKIGRFIDTRNLSLRTPTDIPRGENVEIYITNNEEIKEGDWVINLNSPYAHKELCRIDNQLELERYAKKTSNNCKKIILTTDDRLIVDGVQAINDEFLEWVIKNSSCEFVETIYGLFNPMGRQVNPMNLDQNHSQCFWKYKIIIPQDQPEQEEVSPKPVTAVEWLINQYEQRFGNSITTVMIDEIATAIKMGKQCYSEEEVINSIQYTVDNFFNGKLAGLNSQEIFEQFKKGIR